jgi:hypothetical protein
MNYAAFERSILALASLAAEDDKDVVHQLYTI